MSRRNNWFVELAANVAQHRWRACPQLVFRVLYGLPPGKMLLATTAVMQKYLPAFEARWPVVTWPREIVANPKDWIRRFGRSLPDDPEFQLIGDAKFKFSLDALLLGCQHSAEAGVLASSCACALLETLGAMVQERIGPQASVPDALGCQTCGAQAKPQSPADPDSPIEVARSVAWQLVLDELMTRHLDADPDTLSGESLEMDLAKWERHGMLLIVPESAFLFAER